MRPDSISPPAPRTIIADEGEDMRRDPLLVLPATEVMLPSGASFLTRWLKQSAM